MEDLKILFASVLVSIMMVTILSALVDKKFEQKKLPAQHHQIDQVLLYDDYSDEELNELIKLSAINKKNKSKHLQADQYTRENETAFVYSLSEVPILPHYGEPCKGIRSQNCTNKNIHHFIRKEMDLSVIKDHPNQRTEFVSFTVNTAGQMENITYLRSEGDQCLDCPALALKTLEKMGQWIPGIKNGKAVSVKLELPIKQKITDEGLKYISKIEYLNKGCNSNITLGGIKKHIPNIKKITFRYIC